jgi:hypothetical protein
MVGGGMLFLRGKAANDGLPAFHRVDVPKELAHFTKAFGRR